MAGAAARPLRRRLPRRAARGDRAHHAHQPEIFRLHRRRRAARAGVRLRRQYRRDRRRRGDRRGQPPRARRAADRRALLLGAGLKIPLEEQAKKLDEIVFHEKLGTVADKVERVAKLARWLVEEGIVKGADADQVERAARLAKADLVTGMVGEFPELQGVIGGYLAEAQGEPKAVADAIRDHYKPVGQGDDVPTAPVTVAVELGRQAGYASAPSSAIEREADRIEGSVRASPRRARVDRDHHPQCAAAALTEAMRGALANRAGQSLMRAPRHRLDRTARESLDFFADRLKVQQREAGVRHDLIDAVFALGGEDDLVRLLARVKALRRSSRPTTARTCSPPTSARPTSSRRRIGQAQVMSSRRAGHSADRRGGSAGAVDEPILRSHRGNGIGQAVPTAEEALIAALDAAEPKASAAVETRISPARWPRWLRCARRSTRSSTGDGQRSRPGQARAPAQPAACASATP